jgi:hypothetical protein
MREKIEEREDRIKNEKKKKKKIVTSATVNVYFYTLL